jgi:hypothetical protein
MSNPYAFEFKEYLDMLCIEQAEFKSLAINVRMELLAGFRQQASSADVAASLPKTVLPSPPAESSVPTVDCQLGH